jgi:histone-lysine N-methyltransferase SETMAR
MSIRRIAEKLGISLERVNHILREELGIIKVSTRWVPKLLRREEKFNRVQFAKELLKRYSSKYDETLIHHYDPETRTEAKQWKHKTSPTPTRPKTQKLAKKVMAKFFWVSEGLLLIDYLPRGVTVTGEYYSNLLRRLRDAIKEKRRGKLGKGVLLLRDNARPHTCSLSMATAAELNFELVPHSAYSPDMAPSDYHLFKNLKKHLRERNFKTMMKLKRQ